MAAFTDSECILIIKNILQEYGNDFSYIYKYFNKKKDRRAIQILYDQILTEEARHFSEIFSDEGTEINKILDIYYKEDEIYYKVTKTIENKEKIFKDHKFIVFNNHFFKLLVDYKYTIKMKSHLIKYLSCSVKYSESSMVNSTFIKNDDLEIVNSAPEIFSSGVNESVEKLVDLKINLDKPIKLAAEENQINEKAKDDKKTVTFVEDEKNNTKVNLINFLSRSRE